MFTARNYNAFFRQLLFLGLLIAIGWIILHHLAFFIGSFLGATALYVIVRPLLFKLTDTYHWKPGIASLLLVTILSIIVLALGYLIFEVIAGEIASVDTSSIVQTLHKLPRKINQMVGYPLITSNLLSQSASVLTQFFSSILNTTYSFVANILMMILLLFFMMSHAQTLEKVLFDYLPFSGKSMEMIKKEFQNMVFSNTVGIPLVMFCQALTAAAVYELVGLNNVVFWAFFTALCGLIPMVGSVIVTLPMGIYLISSGQIWQGVVVIVCGVLVIATVDNICRIFTLKKFADTHPLIVIFGVILGIPLFGFWGIIFGPLLLSSFLLLIKIYYIEYRLLPQNQTDTQPEPIAKEKTGN